MAVLGTFLLLPLSCTKALSWLCWRPFSSFPFLAAGLCPGCAGDLSPPSPFLQQGPVQVVLETFLLLPLSCSRALSRLCWRPFSSFPFLAAGLCPGCAGDLSTPSPFLHQGPVQAVLETFLLLPLSCSRALSRLCWRPFSSFPFLAAGLCPGCAGDLSTPSPFLHQGPVQAVLETFLLLPLSCSRALSRLCWRPFYSFPFLAPRPCPGCAGDLSTPSPFLHQGPVQVVLETFLLLPLSCTKALSRLCWRPFSSFPFLAAGLCPGCAGDLLLLPLSLPFLPVLCYVFPPCLQETDSNMTPQPQPVSTPERSLCTQENESEHTQSSVCKHCLVEINVSNGSVRFFLVQQFCSWDHCRTVSVVLWVINESKGLDKIDDIVWDLGLIEGYVSYFYINKKDTKGHLSNRGVFHKKMLCCRLLVLQYVKKCYILVPLITQTIIVCRWVSVSNCLMNFTEGAQILLPTATVLKLLANSFHSTE